MTTRVEMELHAGMRNHSYMYNRDAANQHPMSAITGLNDKLAGMGSVVEMTAFTGAMNAATVDGPAVTVTSPTDRMSEAMWNELAVGKYIIGPEGVKIFRCTAKTETSFSAVCVSVANLRGEKGDKGDTGNTGPKGDAFKYSDFTADQLAALKGPKGDTGSTGPAGAKGDAYEITSADYEAIAEIVEDEYTEELASVKNDLRTLKRKNKALTDLLNGQELRFDTESITGASIDVASGCVADSVLKVSGKSVVVNQLMPTIPTQTQNGVTVTNNGDGSYTFNGTSTASQAFPSVRNFKAKTGHKYYFKGVSGSGLGCLISSSSVSGSVLTPTSTQTGDSIFTCSNSGDDTIDNVIVLIRAYNDTTYNNVTIKPQLIDLTQMFGSGNEPSLSECQKIFTSSYYSYNTGTIVSSQTDSVKVRGKNLFDPSECEAGYVSDETGEFFTSAYASPNSNASGFIKVYPSETYYIYSSVMNGGRWGAIYDSNKHYISGIAGYNKAFVMPSNASYIRITVNYNNTNADYANNIIVVKGNEQPTYSPYSLNTITTSFPVLKSAGSVSDYIDLASARPSTNAGKSIVDVVRCVGSVDLGSLDWNYVSGGTRFYSTSIDALVKSNSDVNAISNCVCNMFETNSPANTWNVKDNIVAINNGATSKILVRATSYGTDATAFKTAMNGVMLYYEKATPTTETLEIPTDLLNAINVEAGGQITFVDHNSSLAMPITTTNEWVVRNEEV